MGNPSLLYRGSLDLSRIRLRDEPIGSLKNPRTMQKSGLGEGGGNFDGSSSYPIELTLIITEKEDSSMEVSFLFSSFSFSLRTSSSSGSGDRTLSDRMRLGLRPT